jgi:hypothetical protein
MTVLEEELKWQQPSAQQEAQPFYYSQELPRHVVGFLNELMKVSDPQVRGHTLFSCSHVPCAGSHGAGVLELWAADAESWDP